MTQPAALQLENVTFGYTAEPVLQQVNLSIQAKEMAYVVGPNGGGKTTLLRLMLGLLQPSQGTVRVFGEPPEKVRRRLGYVPQYTSFDLQFPVSVLDVVLMGRVGRSALGLFGRSDYAAARRALGEVGLDSLHRRPFADLSGGQRQRVLIARALASGPEIMLLDEPMANVDWNAQQSLYELLQGINQRMGIVWVSHDLYLVSKSVSNVICVNRRVTIHPTSDLSSEGLKEIFGSDVALVLHDHKFIEGSTCSHS
jgi:zinc transport system ATP-binding protein